MGSLTWDDTYSVNVKKLDDQHKELIALVGELNNAMIRGKGEEVLGEILEKLLQYTRTHFAEEERMMEIAGYPDIEVHKATHAWIAERVAEIRRNYRDGKATISQEVPRLLERWVLKHIMGTDKDYAPYLDAEGK